MDNTGRLGDLHHPRPPFSSRGGTLGRGDFRSGRRRGVARRPLDGGTPGRPPAIFYARSTSTPPGESFGANIVRPRFSREGPVVARLSRCAIARSMAHRCRCGVPLDGADSAHCGSSISEFWQAAERVTGAECDWNVDHRITIAYLDAGFYALLRRDSGAEASEFSLRLVPFRDAPPFWIIHPDRPGVATCAADRAFLTARPVGVLHRGGRRSTQNAQSEVNPNDRRGPPRSESRDAHPSG
jgi:hypothetical protein